VNKNYTPAAGLRCLFLLLAAGVSLLAGCQGRKANNEPARSGQRGVSVTRFDEVEKVISLGGGEYAWLLTTEDNHQLLPGSIYLTSEYGRILNKEKPILGGEHIESLWSVEGKAYRAWAKNKNSIFFIDTPQKADESQAPLVNGTTVKKVFAISSEEGIFDLQTVPNSKLAWLIVNRGSYDSGLYFLDADSPTPAKEVALPEKVRLDKISAARDGTAAWLTWTKALEWPNYQDAIMFVENKDGVFSFSKPILWDPSYRIVNPLIPVKEGKLAWDLSTTWPALGDYSGTKPTLLSSDGTKWDVGDILFAGEEIHYGASAKSDVSRLWVIVKGKPGIYIIVATGDGPKIEKQLLGNINPDAIYPARDNMSAWVFADDGRRAYYVTSDGIAQEMEINLGEGIKPFALTSSPDGKKAWLVAFEGSGETMRFHLFFLNRDLTGPPQKIPLALQSWFVEALSDNQHAVVTDSTTSLFSFSSSQQFLIYLLDGNKVDNDGDPLLALEHEDTTGGVSTTNTPLGAYSSTLWVGSYKKRAWSLKWGQGAIASASVDFNGKASLTYDSARPEKQQSTWAISPGTRVENGKVKLVLNNNRQPEDADGSVQLVLQDSTNGQMVEKTPEVKLQESRPLQLNWTPSLNHPYDIVLNFRDAYGTRSIIRWSKVEFKAPLWQRPWFRTLIAFLLLCGLSALTLTLRPIRLGVRRWLPLLCVVLGSATTFFDWIGAQGIDAHMFAWLVLGSAVILTLVGLVSTTVYRTLAQIQPFHVITPYFLLLPSMRRRIFAPYVKALRDQLQLSKRLANSEVYTAIPATIEDQNDKKIVANPADELAKSLTNASRQRPNILIEAPGGSGKSALVREVMEQSLAIFIQNPRASLPVLCDGSASSLDEMAMMALGKYAISPETMRTQIEAGHFFLVIDGPQERKISAEQISKWIRSERTETASLLIASRPKDDVRRSIQIADYWWLVIPERLSDETLELFQDAYLKTNSAESDHVSQKLTENVKAVCRGSDGTYLPILIRLALLVGSQEVDSVARLYESAFKFLLRVERDEGGSLLDQASELCVETYWKTGLRQIVFDRATGPRSQLMKRLLEAGVLVPADTVIRSVGEPREVRFFHDSMQSYLTARGLLNGATPWATTLSEAAGNPRFRESERAQNPDHGSELFRMCLLVFGPQIELQRALKSDLLSWSKVHEKNLTRNDVERVLSEPVLHKLNERVAPELGASVVLAEAVSLLTNSADLRAIEELGGLYARIAEKVWRLDASDGRNGSLK
jgi:hypothetical protein